jgi:hypothetical protein
MKTTFILMFSLFLIHGSLLGQNENFYFNDADIKGSIVVPGYSIAKGRILSDSKLQDSLFKKNIELFKLDSDSSLRDLFAYKHLHDSTADDKFPDISPYYGNPFNIIPDSHGKIRILKPDKNAKYYLIIKDPIRHTVTK